jgi:hypothetical protein
MIHGQQNIKTPYLSVVVQLHVSAIVCHYQGALGELQKEGYEVNSLFFCCYSTRETSPVMWRFPNTVDPLVTTGLTYEQLGLRPKF